MPKGVHNNHVAGPWHPRWGNGRMVDPEGYYMLRVGKGHPLANSHGQASEQDIIYAAALGAAQVKGKLIHHKNGIITDNRLSNLVCLSRSEHNHIHCPGQPRDESGRWIGYRRKRYARGK